MKESKHMMELYKQIHEQLERERKESEQIIKHNEMSSKGIAKSWIFEIKRECWPA